MAEQQKNELDRDTLLRVECIRSLPGVLMSSDNKDAGRVLSGLFAVALGAAASPDVERTD